MKKIYDIFVSTNGNDSGDGSFKNPVRTFAAAQKLARQISTEGKNVTVAFRKGVYFAENRELSNEDGAINKNSYVTYCNYEGENVIFSGSIPILGWKEEKNGIYSADLPYCDRNCIVLENQKAMTKACFPKEGYYRVSHQPIPVGEEKHLTYCNLFGYPEEINLDQITEDDGLEAFIFPGGPSGEWNWFSKIYLVTKIDREHRIVEIQRDIGTNGEFYIGVNSRFRFQNALCFLTNKGEYVIDRNNKKIFCIPNDKRSLAEGKITIAMDTPVIRVNGTKDRIAENICIRGISLCGAGLNRGALELENTKNIYIDNLCISSAGYGVYAKGQNEGITIKGCCIEEISNTGIYIEGEKERNVSRNHLICENMVKNVGVVLRHGCGIMLFNCKDSVIRKNTVTESPRYAISLKGEWPQEWFALTDEQKRSSEILSGNNLIEENDCSHVNLDTQDTGVIELWHAGAKNKICRNYIHDSSIYFSFGFGLYIDDFNVDTQVYENVFYRLKSEGEGTLLAAIGAKFAGNSFKNNFIVECECNYGILLCDFEDQVEEPLLDATIDKNIFYDSWSHNAKKLYGNYLRLDKYLLDEKDVKKNIRQYIRHCDNNIVYMSEKARSEGAPYASVQLHELKNISIDQWREMFGYDLNTNTRNPLFKAPEKGDFSFLENSPAITLKICPLNMNKTGCSYKKTGNEKSI